MPQKPLRMVSSSTGLEAVYKKPLKYTFKNGRKYHNAEYFEVQINIGEKLNYYMGLFNLDQFDHNNKMNTLSVITLKDARCILFVTVIINFKYSLEKCYFWRFDSVL
jgi:hypothetical protein